MNEQNLINKQLNDNKRSLILLVGTLLGFTIIYQLRPILDDEQFMWISIPTYAIVPGILTVYSAILTIKLHKQKQKM